MASIGSSIAPHGSVIDIGESGMDAQILDKIRTLFVEPKKRNETPYLPDELLYHEEGQNIWSTIIQQPEYYQFQDDCDLLEKNGEQIANYIPPGCTLIDLGAGNAQKVEHLLAVLEKRKQLTLYLALDISKISLEQNMAFLSKNHSYVHCIGLYGTFSDALKWRTQIDSPWVFLSFGSVLFNDDWETASEQLREWSAVMREADMILAGMDGHRVPQDYDKIKVSYNSSDLYAKYWQHGFHRANALIGEDCFRLEDWSVHSVITSNPVRHFFAFRARHDIILGNLGVTFKKDEEMEWFDGHKYSEEEVRTMCSKAGLHILEVWKAENSEMRQYLIKSNIA